MEWWGAHGVMSGGKKGFGDWPSAILQMQMKMKVFFSSSLFFCVFTLDFYVFSSMLFAVDCCCNKSIKQCPNISFGLIWLVWWLLSKLYILERFFDKTWAVAITSLCTLVSRMMMFFPMPTPKDPETCFRCRKEKTGNIYNLSTNIIKQDVFFHQRHI